MAEGGTKEIKERSSSRNRERNRILDWEAIDLENLRKLKQARGAKKGLITKAQNGIKELMTDRANVDLGKVKLEELNVLVEDFRSAHAVYHNQLVEECDIDESHGYLKSVEQSITDLGGDIARWIVTSGTLDPNDDLVDLNPEDSISNAGSRAVSKHTRRSKPSSVGSRGSSASSVSAAPVKATAKRAMLEAEAANLEKFNEIQKEELNLQLRKKALELQTEIAKVQAEELTFIEAETDYRKIFPKPGCTAEPKRSPDSHLSNWTNSRNQPKDAEQPTETIETPLGQRGTSVDVKPLNPYASSWTPEFPAKSDEKPSKPIDLPNIKPDPNIHGNESKYSTPSTTESLAEKLLEAQCIQNQQFQALIQRQQERTLALTLPQPNVPMFSGNPIDYWSFIRAFENLIEKKTTSESARLYYLVQYTTGEVQDLIKSCLTMRDEVGYREARDLLQKRYGSSYRIATAYVDKLTRGPAIKAENGDALRRFSIVLTGCKNTLKEIGYLNKLENPDTLKTIVQRLPYGLRQKWRDVADNITENQKRDITIADLSDFVTAKARTATHAIFGDISGQASSSHGAPKAKQKFSSRNTSTFATQVNPRHGCNDARKQPNQAERKCPLCSSSHWLSQCDGFKGKSLADRWQFVNSRGLCVNCLVAGHSANSCPKQRFCRVTGCNGNHSSYLHPRSMEAAANKNAGNTAPPQPQTRNQENEQSVLNGYVEGRNHHSSAPSLALLPVKVKAPGCDYIIETYAFLDSGSNATFCSEELPSHLGLSGRQTSLALTTMEKEDSKAMTSVVSLEVMDLEEENAVELPLVFTRPKLPVTVENGAQQEDVDRWPHLSGIKIPKINAKVGLLIGSDAPEILQPKEVRESCRNGPYATRTIFGWVVNGPLRRAQDSVQYTANFIRADAELSEQFRSYCNMEFNDSAYGGKPSLSQNDKRALEIMQETAMLENGHYTIALPWKDDPPCLENNRSVADHLLRLLKKRLLKDRDLLTKYKACIEDLIQKGYAEKAPPTEIKGKTWYLPHHAVFHPAKPEKIRVVFDCSAKYRGNSLNDKLLQGPDFTNSLVGVLTRFRQESVAIISDVEAMFHQVNVNPEDCNALRFLWWPNGDLASQPEELMMTVHLFGGVSSPSCANFALRKTAEDNKASFNPETVRTVERNFYVDDCLKAVASEESATLLVKDLTELLSKGGFRLTKWLSNSRKVVESIPETERATAVKSLDFDLAVIERALGVQWQVSSDTFGFSISIKDRPATRRGILSVISSVYDPLGFIAPFVLPAMVILQDLCKKKLDWDDRIPEEDLTRWQTWLSELPKLERFRVDRCFKPRDFGEVASCQLHFFSDASQSAYGAVAYLRMVNMHGKVHCSFVMGKSRLAPLKPMTIPRMELSAAVLSTRLDKLIREEIEYAIDSSVFWTDSTCVLRYVENDERRYQTFVANRVSAIREQSLPSQWRYVDTKLNPADDASRGMSADDIVQYTRWTKGPSFLWNDEATWPKLPAAMIRDQSENFDPEVVKASFVGLAHPSAIQMGEFFERFSCWYKLKKFVAWILRFKSGTRDAVTRRRQGGDASLQPDKKVRPLDVEEMENAERAIIQVVQAQRFDDELLSLKGAKREIKESSSVVKLDPVLVDGILCVGGRLQNSPIQDRHKHPAILPKDHHVSLLIMRYYHSISGHSGLEHTLSLIREKYWVTQARVLLRRILGSCVDCRKRQAAVGQQKMASLPAR